MSPVGICDYTEELEETCDCKACVVRRFLSNGMEGEVFIRGPDVTETIPLWDVYYLFVEQMKEVGLI